MTMCSQPDSPDSLGLVESSLHRSAHAPIGVFDSGVGGLTVLRAIAHRLPRESLLYFGDTARLPYGTRSQAEIIQFVREILTWMLDHSVKMVVMACNTSSALALDLVRSEFNVPILGVILPAARVAVSQGQRIGVIATPATASSQAYSRAMQEISPSVKVWELGCPEFVPLIEQNQIYDVSTQRIVSQYLNQLMEHDIDTLVYGCTHYPHLKPVVDRVLPSTVRQIDPALYVAEATANELKLLNLQNSSRKRQIRFCVSDRPERFAQLTSQWFGGIPEVEHVNLTSRSNVTHGDLSAC